MYINFGLSHNSRFNFIYLYKHVPLPFFSFHYFFMPNGDFYNGVYSKFISDTIMFVSSSMAMRDRSSEGARFEVLNADYR